MKISIYNNMNLQESIRRILREETSDYTEIIETILDHMIINKYKDLICGIRVIHPKDMEDIPVGKIDDRYELVFTFVRDEKETDDIYFDIMDEAWYVVRDYLNIEVWLQQEYVKQCN